MTEAAEGADVGGGGGAALLAGAEVVAGVVAVGMVGEAVVGVVEEAVEERGFGAG